MLDNKVLIENIRRLCEKHNMKITNLEKTLGFGAGIINRWGNDADPSLSKIIQIADFFQVSIDDIVGYNNIINDEFLQKLVLDTESRNIRWKAYENQSESPKQHFSFSDLLVDDFSSKEDYDNFIMFHREVSFYTKIENGFLSLYGQYNGYDIKHPEELKLFIQPSFEAGLIPRNEYVTKQLKPLWLKVLYCIGTNTPDEIKAEELKNNYINSNINTNCKYSNPTYYNHAAHEIGHLVQSMDPEVVEAINALNTPELIKVRQLLSDPSIMALIEQTSKIADLLKDVNIK